MIDPNELISDGPGESTLSELAELRKALEIGYSTTGDVPRVESLDSTLRLMSFTAQHVKLWNQIPKQDAYSTVEEYNRLDSYGSDAGGFVASGQLPEEEDSQYARADQKVKYLGTTRSVHHPATLVRTALADLIGQETQNGALWLMEKANRALYFGDSDVIPLEWNGVIKQIIDGAGTVVDLKGAPMDKGDLDALVQSSTDNYGTITKIFANSKVFSDFSTTFAGQLRWNVGGGATPGIAGTPLTGWSTQNGIVMFEPDSFVRQGGAPPTAATSPKAPNAPTLSVGSPGTVAGSVFETADAGTYKYQITSVNQYGESAPCALSGGTAYTAGQGATLTITDGGGSYGATGYKIYRTEKGGSSTYYTHKAIARAKSGNVYSSPTTWVDINEWRPKCFMAVALDMSPQSLNFRQLLPMLKMNLAVLSPAIRWMQLLYGTPIVYAPKRNVVLKNVGSSA